jgi:hypothetical protein
MFAVCAAVGCAAAGMGGLDAQGTGDGAGSGDGPAATSETCPPDQFATNVDGSRKLTCVPLDPLSKQAIGDHCSAYLGARDNCDGCATPPAKWGRASTGSCSPGTGTNNTCTMPTLGGAPVHLFGLDLDGDVDGNDKLYGGLHCTADTSSDGVVPCPAGQVIDGFNGTAWTCSSFAKMVINYVHTNCSLYLGWQDGCDGCTSPPTKWGYTSETACMNGAGADNTCIDPTLLGAESVRLFGLNFDGDVDGNDKLHVALRCEPGAPATSMQTTVCPAGQYVTATTAGGFTCTAAAPAIAKYFGDHCTLYFGWHDGCDGCLTPPTKWGTVRVAACANGLGADNTCSTFTLGQSVQAFGLSPDGDVDGNDVLYVGFRCD